MHKARALCFPNSETACANLDTKPQQGIATFTDPAVVILARFHMLFEDL